jgi:hypothetical protein
MAENIAEQEWDAVEEWKVLELMPDFQRFQIAFMTESERRNYLGPWSEEEKRAMELDEEAEARLNAELDEWHERRRAKTLALSQQLGCTLYLATYLIFLNDKLDRIAEAVRGGKLPIQEPSPKKRKSAA